MYKVYLDNKLAYDPRLEELAILNPKLDLEENKAGSFSFTLPPEHPFYGSIKKRKTMVDVYQDDEIIYSGTCIEETNDFFLQKNIYSEGDMCFFNDTIQRPTRYQNVTVRGLLETYINIHNAQVNEDRRFKVGAVTVTDPNDSISCYTNMESTMTALKEDLVDDLGGYFRVRHTNGERYIDYLKDSLNTNSQTIKIGNNLLDFTTNIDLSEIATAIIPLGKKLDKTAVEGLETRLDIKYVNDGKDFVYSEDAVNNYGWIYKVVEWDDVTNASILKNKGEKYLSEIQFENMIIQAKAIDLHLAKKSIERFKLSDEIRVISTPHGLDKRFRLTKMTIYLNAPEKNTVTLGKTERTTLSAQTNKVNQVIKDTIDNITPTSSILMQAKENATELITNAMGGYVVKTESELLIMDTPDVETARKVWRWNMNGLGYSSTGYNGEFELAMTMDGKIVADFITAGKISSGVLSANVIQSVWNAITGYIQIQGGELLTKDTNGKTASSLNRYGQYFYFDGNMVGKIGTNNFSSNPDVKGLVFDLEEDAGYMCWASKDTDAGNYITRLVYYNDNRINKKGLHFSSDTFCHSDLKFSDYVSSKEYANGDAGITSSSKGFLIDSTNSQLASDGTSLSVQKEKFTFYNSENLLVDCFNNIDMHSFSILNQSDARLKENITPTGINALDIVSEIELQSYDWIETGEHVDCGIIAQQLAKIYPEAVMENAEGVLSIKIEKLIPILIKAVQELSGREEKNTWRDRYKDTTKKEFAKRHKVVRSAPKQSKEKLIEPQIINMKGVIEDE